MCRAREAVQVLSLATCRSPQNEPPEGRPHQSSQIMDDSLPICGHQRSELAGLKNT